MRPSRDCSPLGRTSCDDATVGALEHPDRAGPSTPGAASSPSVGRQTCRQAAPDADAEVAAVDSESFCGRS